jgi:DNA-binding IclR family transcriptional regulator
MSVSELAENVGTSKANIVRDLANLEMAGFAKRLEMNAERWRHGDAVAEMYANFSSSLLGTMRRVMNEAVSAATRSGTMID